VSVVGDTIYCTGTQDKRGVLYALNLGGKIKWQGIYGSEWTKDRPMSRTTPTIDGGFAYVYSGNGWAACFNVQTGAKVWTVDTLSRFRGRNIQWGIAESPLVLKDVFICHPGGPDAAVVALDKRSGKPVWTSKDLSDKSAYCSPLAIHMGSEQQIVTQTENHIVGLDAKTGSVLWKIRQRNRWAVHPNTPLFFDGLIYISSGYRYGSQLLKLSADGAEASQVWRERQLDNHHEGVLFINGCIYGSGSGSRLLCLDPKDGKVLYRVAEVRKAAIVYAGDRLYAYDEKGGGVFLVNVSPKGYKIAGKFTVTKGSGPHWAHPVVANGVLYIRHGEVLMAYDVKEK